MQRNEELKYDQDWEYLGEGRFNIVYRNSTNTWVLKIPKDPNDPRSRPTTAVHRWNEVNPNMAAQKISLSTPNGKSKNGWICPFVTGRQATDAEIATAIMDIFNRCGRIVLDGCVLGNILIDSNGKAVCVDVDLAVRLESEENKSLDRKRTFSRTSLWQYKFEFIDDEATKKINLTWLYKLEILYPKTIRIITALLALKLYINPAIVNADFLKSNPLAQKLSDVYFDILDYGQNSCLKRIITLKARVERAHEAHCMLDKVEKYHEYSEKKWILDRLAAKIFNIHRRGNQPDKLYGLLKIYLALADPDPESIHKYKQVIKDNLTYIEGFDSRVGKLKAWIKQSIFNTGYNKTMSDTRLLVNKLSDFNINKDMTSPQTIPPASLYNVPPELLIGKLGF